MINFPKNLPVPGSEALQQSNRLIEHIKDQIAQADGLITFEKYMELALYTPGLGYYSGGSRKLGADGDFVTAPEISPLFGQCVARQCQQVLRQLQTPIILEFGAGTGRLVTDILLELERRHCLPDKYCILEVSAELRERQQQMLQERVPHLFSRIVWLDRLPDQPFTGVVLANEVMDAMPVTRFCIEGNSIQELYVAWDDQGFTLRKIISQNKRLIEQVQKLQEEYLLDVTSYESEINFYLPGWLQSIKNCLQHGMVLLLDYGFPAREYYHPDRSTGTLMCHYRQHAHTNPFYLPGLQDITAHVDFTAVAEAAVSAGFTVAGYTTQAAFLIACGLLEFASLAAENGGDANEENIKQQLIISRQVQTLTAPHEMGELFKVIALTHGCDAMSLLGFEWQDQRFRL